MRSSQTAWVLAHGDPDVGVEEVGAAPRPRPRSSVSVSRAPVSAAISRQVATSVSSRPECSGAHRRTSMPSLQPPTISELPMLLRASPRKQ